MTASRSGGADGPEPAEGARRRGFDLTTPARAGLALLGAVLLLFVLWYVAHVLLLVFAGSLLAILLRAASQGLCGLIRLPIAFCATFIALVVVAGVVVGGWLIAPVVVQQAAQLIDGLADAVEAVIRALRRADWDETLAGQIDLGQVLPDPGGLMGGATGVLTATFGGIATVAIILFLGIYLAANPQAYIDGFALLLPRPHRLRARYVLHEIGRTLRWWLIGQAVSMAVIGTISFIGLWLLGVPFAAPLAVMAGLLNFVPYLGPLMSAVPITLVALTESGTLALYTLGFYAGLQMFEGYVLTPLVQRQAAHLPPALNIFAQMLMGVLFGVLGIALATPLAAAALVAVKLVYVEGVLGEEVEVR